MASDYSFDLSFIKFSLETLGKPEGELKRGSGTARCHKGKYVLKKDGSNGVANWIWQIVDLSILTFWLRAKRLRSCTALRFCRACRVSSKHNNERAAIHVGSVFFRLHAAKYRKENEGIPKNQQVLLAHSEVYVYINSVAKNA